MHLFINVCLFLWPVLQQEECTYVGLKYSNILTCQPLLGFMVVVGGRLCVCCIVFACEYLNALHLLGLSMHLVH